MAKTARVGFMMALLAGLFVISVWAQQQQTPAAGLPFEGGVYYRVDSGWVPLSRTVLLPLMGAGNASYLNVGHRGATAELPGPQALVRINNARPTFFVRGFSPTAGLYLLREDAKRDHRELHTSVGRHLDDGPKFRESKMYDLEIQTISPGVISVRPKNNLAPGEYVLVPPAEPQYRWIHFGYSFGVPMSGSGS